MNTDRPNSGVLVVTGASRGIGSAVARLGAARGYAVCVNFREQEREASALVDEINLAGGIAISVQADVSVDSDVSRLFTTVDLSLGPVTALVNNVGIIGGERRVDEWDVDALQKIWSTNVTSAFICSREAIRRMSTKYGGFGGAIVNISSLAGRNGGSSGRVHYSTSKGAINTFTIGLAREVAAEGVRVNAIAPGLTSTEIHDAYGGTARITRQTVGIPMGRPGTVQESANAVIWLLSHEASYITGTVLELTGGK
jgi:NAD(P)-dependent dehydrogenase (short-subunit alcohol dehydrogenase family)